MTRGHDGASSEIGNALSVAVAYAGEEKFHDVLSEALKHRDLLEKTAYVRAIDEFQDASFDTGIEGILREALQVRSSVSNKDIEAELVSVLDGASLKKLIGALDQGSTSDQKSAEFLRVALNRDSTSAYLSALQSFFLTAKDEPRKRLMTQAVQKDHPDLLLVTQRAQESVHRLVSESKALRVVQATVALLMLADAVMQAYTDLKVQRSALDFDDLIQKTEGLLVTSGSTDWVLYKLDGGIDHILVDESQDTSPEQWRIIESLAQEFFAGSGAREVQRSLFAVGDEKQSIFGFQGAAPEMFSAKGKHYEALAHDAGVRWSRVPLDLSFRSVSPVLDAVDHVFGDGAREIGLGMSESFPQHFSARSGFGGLVEVWPTETPADVADSDTWAPLDQDEAVAPAQRLAEKLAKKIEGWLRGKEKLLSEDRPIEPSDILILVRKRRPFAPTMIGALKARNIPVAGADRMTLIEQIAVKDLMALGDFLTLPEDDLSLACVLKSPMFGFDDDDLFAIGFERKGSLWRSLLSARSANEKCASAVKTLIGWRSRADYLPPFEFFSEVLDKDGMRSKLLARLGADAADSIDEFLNLALNYDLKAPASLAGFLVWLRASDREIKRDMEQSANAVRIMTVHGAKGLEAPIVILADTCSPPESQGSTQPLVKLEDVERPKLIPEPFVWLIKGAKNVAGVRTADDKRKERERQEHARLLYVAMTRARDRLYVTGFEGKRGRAADCWYNMISEGLEGIADEVTNDDGLVVLRLQSHQIVEPKTTEMKASGSSAPSNLPPWAMERAPREPRLSIPLAPSQLAPYEADEEGEPATTGKPTAEAKSEFVIPDEPPPQSALADADERRFLRGTITHALLEHLPGIDSTSWERVAVQYVNDRGRMFGDAARHSIVREVLKILNDPHFQPLFGPKSRAEVVVAANLPPPNGKGPHLHISGQIDRLADTGDEILIVDYKTNRPPPYDVHKVADAYLYQLVAYRVALREIYPEKRLRTAILWTHSANLMEISSSRIEKYESQLWDLAAGTS